MTLNPSASLPFPEGYDPRDRQVLGPFAEHDVKATSSGQAFSANDHECHVSRAIRKIERNIRDGIIWYSVERFGKVR